MKMVVIVQCRCERLCWAKL